MLTLYLLRHGQTDYNLQNIIQGGGIDSDLNETGRKQAQAFFDTYGHIPFDRVFCSRLKRTAQTLAPFVAAGYTLEPHEGVNEFNWGDLEGQSYNETNQTLFKQVTDAWKRGELDTGMTNGETPIVAWKRCKGFFESLQNEYKNQDVTILICTHGRMLRIVLAQLLGKGMENMDTFPHHNTALNVLEINDEGVVSLKVLNDLTHLNALSLC